MDYNEKYKLAQKESLSNKHKITYFEDNKRFCGKCFSDEGYNDYYKLCANCCIDLLDERIFNTNEKDIYIDEISQNKISQKKIQKIFLKHISNGGTIFGAKEIIKNKSIIVSCKKCNIKTDTKTDIEILEIRSNIEDMRINILDCISCRRTYRNNYRVSSDLIKMSFNLRARTSMYFKKKGFVKDIKSAELLGCTFLKAKEHIEKQFTKGMTWDNYGKWHIYHIMPLCSAENLEQLKELCKYHNLQPLWKIDNIKKNGVKPLICKI